MKRIALICFIISVIILIISLLAPLVIMSTYDNTGDSVGVIGGADIPTYEFIISKHFGVTFYVAVCLTISVSICSLLYLIFGKK